MRILPVNETGRRKSARISLRAIVRKEIYRTQTLAPSAKGTAGCENTSGCLKKSKEVMKKGVCYFFFLLTRNIAAQDAAAHTASAATGS